jgi:hypothetical protein
LGREEGLEGAGRSSDCEQALMVVIDGCYILLMFLFDFKPQFLNYPLDSQEYVRVTVRAQEIAKELSGIKE